MKVFVVVLAVICLCNAKSLKKRIDRQDVEDYLSDKTPGEIRAALAEAKGWVDGVIAEGAKLLAEKELFNDDLEPIPAIDEAIEFLKSDVSPFLDYLPDLPEAEKMHFLDDCIATAMSTDFSSMADDKERLTVLARQVFTCAGAGLKIISRNLDMSSVDDADLSLGGALSTRFDILEAVIIEMGHLAKFVLEFVAKAENGVLDFSFDKRSPSSKEELLKMIENSSPQEIRDGAAEMEDGLEDAIAVMEKMIELDGVLGDDFKPTAKFMELAKQLKRDEKKEKELMDNLPDLDDNKPSLFLKDCEETAKNTNFDDFDTPKAFLNEVFRQVLVCGVSGLEVMKELVDLEDVDDANLNVAGLIDRVTKLEQAVIEMGHLGKWTAEFIERVMETGFDGSANDLVDLQDRMFKSKKGPKPTGFPMLSKGPKPTGGPKPTWFELDDEDRKVSGGKKGGKGKGSKGGKGKGPKPTGGPRPSKGPKPTGGPRPSKGPKPTWGPKIDKKSLLRRIMNALKAY